ncbi:MAG: hypothetical protein NC244_07035 [Alistipes senegalensis]|nr:hypothetical protein [Alistipes senegalensis]
MHGKEITNLYENDLSARINDIENNRNLSETFESFDDFLEDLNAENSKNSQVQPD